MQYNENNIFLYNHIRIIRALHVIMLPITYACKSISLLIFKIGTIIILSTLIGFINHAAIEPSYIFTFHGLVNDTVVRPPYIFILWTYQPRGCRVSPYF